MNTVEPAVGVNPTIGASVAVLSAVEPAVGVNPTIGASVETASTFNPSPSVRVAGPQTISMSVEMASVVEPSIQAFLESGWTIGNKIRETEALAVSNVIATHDRLTVEWRGHVKVINKTGSGSFEITPTTRPKSYTAMAIGMPSTSQPGITCLR